MGEFKQLAFSELKFLKSGKNSKDEQLYGVKRRVKLQKEKLQNSIDRLGDFDIIKVAELPNGEKYLLDGYARWELESRQLAGGFAIIKKHPAWIIPAKDLDHVKELYCQVQSSYGSSSWEDFREMDSPRGEVEFEIPGLCHPNFDLSIMTREEVAKAVLSSKYQII